MRLEDLKRRLLAIGLEFDDLEDGYVGALYIGLLEEVCYYFGEEVAGYQGNTIKDNNTINYDFVQQALIKNFVILKKLCDQFNKYAWQAIIKDSMDKGKFIPTNKDLKTVSNEFERFRETDEYIEYYQNNVFNGSDDGNILLNLAADFSRTNQALGILKNNYIHSITLCCERVVADIDDIQNVFFPGENLTRLIEIASTGSDTHKQGLQVLILTFQVALNNNDNVSQGDDKRKLVYKPRDIEIDSLICGDSNSLKDIPNYLPIYNQRSMFTLFEFLNTKILDYKNQQLQILGTYKFLPRCYATNLQNNQTIENVYGYVEFLSYDYQVNEQTDEQKIRDFYTAIGQLMAITVSFSMCDIHCDNLIVHQHQPYLVDLENSLVQSCYDVWGACFSMYAVGFIAQEKKDNLFSVLRGNKQNRLKTKADKPLLPEKYYKFIKNGLSGMMSVIQQSLGELDQQGQLYNWFERLNGVVSRQVPYNTQYWVYLKTEIYNYENCKKNTPINADIDSFFQNQQDNKYKCSEADIYNGWKNQVLRLKALNQSLWNNGLWGFWIENAWKMGAPKFFALQQQYIQNELLYLDIPSYYHVIGTKYLKYYSGENIEIKCSEYITQQQFANFSFVNNQQLLYYFYPDNNADTISPTQAVIVNQQLLPLQNLQECEQRTDTFITQLQNFLFPKNSSNNQNQS